MVRQGFIILIVVFFSLFLSAILNKSSEGFLESSVHSAESDKKLIIINGKALKVDIADNTEERNRGLGGRKFLGKNEGMLFVFQKPDKYSFWMKDMRFPLDIIWINENKTISAVSKNISPETYPASFSPSDPVKYVLEVNAGWSEKNEIKAGDTLIIPNF